MIEGELIFRILDKFNSTTLSLSRLS
jgi:hypothetical protein